MEDNVKLEIQEKSVFERGIIEAFKQNKVSDVYEKLGIAYSELPLYINEIKKQNAQEKNINHFILNSNIIDKLDRLLERNYININILISKIFDIFLDKENLNILSDNHVILINLSNQIVTILDIIKSCDNYYELTEKAINYLSYLIDNSEKFLSSEQTEIITNLQNQLNIKLKSNALTNFQNNLKNILTLCKGETAEEKEKGIEILNSYFSKLNSLNEQIELLCLCGEDIIKAIISKPNPILIDTYYKLCYFFISFLYNFFYKIKLSPFEDENNSNMDDLNISKLNEQYYILDSMEENLEIPDNLYVTKFHGKEYHNMKIINDTLYELDSVKKILLKHTAIFSLAISLLNCLILFQESFKAQFACFLILKRLYFIFPKYINEIRDLIITNIINIISFDEKIINSYKDIFEPYILYLLQKGEENLKNKLKERLDKKKKELKKDIFNFENNNISIDKHNVESDIIFISSFNLNIGCPINIEIAAGDEEEKLIEVKDPNSLLYIGFNLPSYDINFHLIKYCPNIDFTLMSKEKTEKKVQFEEQKYFFEVFKLDKSRGAKIILFIKNPGIYKIIFDNKYSWFNAKLLRYRCNILKELNVLGLSSFNSSDDLNLEKKESEENLNNSDINKEDIKEEKQEEKNNNVKISVKFNNKTNIEDVNLDGDDLNQLDVDIK
jgi:hypothetical protein